MRAAVGIAGALLGAFIVWLVYFKSASATPPPWTARLPEFNVLINAATAAFLLAGYVLIKLQRPRAHAVFMLAATTLSALFLVGYLIYHYHHGDTRYTGQGPARVIYFVILISHIVLSMIQVPLILATLGFAVSGRLERHKKLARITLPIWLYVSLSGIAVYIFLYK